MAVAARFAGTHLAVDVRLPDGTLLSVHAPVDTEVSLGAATEVGLPRSTGVVVADGPDPRS